ncbi:MAG: MFS transporter [Candidatus Helarchaeota archaeon]
MAQSSQKDIWILAFMPFSAAMAASGTLIPLFILALTSNSVSTLGWLSALSSIISLPLAFIWGKLTDDSGKRKIFILIMFLSGLGVLLGYTIASDLLWLIILAIISGLLLGAGDTAKTMYIFDNYPPDLWEEKISKYQQLSGIGAALGLVFGGLFQTFFNNYGYFFLICAILCGVSAVLGFLTLRDTTKDVFKHRIEKSAIINLDLPVYSSVFQPKSTTPYKPSEKEAHVRTIIPLALILYFLAAFTFFLSSNFTFTPLPAFINVELGIAESSIFWIFLGYYIVSVIGYTFTGNLIDRHGNRKILFIGLVMRLVVYGIFTIFSFYTLTMQGTTNAFIGVIILLIFAGLSFAFMNVALQNILPRLVQKNIGEILAINTIIIGAASILGSFSSGFIAETIGYPWLFGFSILTAGIAGLIYWFALKKGNIH